MLPTHSLIRDSSLWRSGTLLLVGLLFAGCLSSRPSAEGEPVLRRARGEASYYGDTFAGRPTASGETFAPETLTAAHRTLPFGTRVRVVRVDVPGEPSVEVRVNDRGPFKRGRIIDLSRAAARELEMVADGIAEVRLEIVSYPEGVEPPEASSTAVGW